MPNAPPISCELNISRLLGTPRVGPITIDANIGIWLLEFTFTVSVPGSQ